MSTACLFCFWAKSVWDTRISHGRKGSLFAISVSVQFRGLFVLNSAWRQRDTPVLELQRLTMEEKTFLGSSPPKLPWDSFALPSLLEHNKSVAAWGVSERWDGLPSPHKASSSSVTVSACRDSPLGLNSKITDHLVQEYPLKMSPSTFPAQGLPELFYWASEKGSPNFPVLFQDSSLCIIRKFFSSIYPRRSF